MKNFLAILMVMILLGLTGCMMIEKMYMPAEESAEGTVQAAVDDADDSFDEIDALDIDDIEKELDISELEKLEQDLDDIDW